MRFESKFDKVMWFNLNAMLIVMILAFWIGLIYCGYKTLEYLL